MFYKLNIKVHGQCQSELLYFLIAIYLTGDFKQILSFYYRKATKNVLEAEDAKTCGEKVCEGL